MKTCKLKVTSLEAREVPANYVWTGNSVNNLFWSNVYNWQADGVQAATPPSFSDKVTIGSGKTCFFDYGDGTPSVYKIAELNLLGSAILDVGTYCNNAKLQVYGATTSTIGDNTSGFTANIIGSVTNDDVDGTAISYKTGGLEFVCDVSVNKANFNFADGTLNYAAPLLFKGDKVNFNTDCVIRANTSFGNTNASLGWTVVTIADNKTINLRDYGKILNNVRGRMVVTNGSIISDTAGPTLPVTNTKTFSNYGVIHESGNFTIKPKLENNSGGQLILVNGILKANVLGLIGSKEYIWNGAGIDTTGAISVFSESEIQFLSDTRFPMSGIMMKGRFNFTEGTVQGYHAHSIPKPTAGDLNIWKYGTATAAFDATGTSTQVQIQSDSNGLCAWNNLGTVNMEIWYDPSTGYEYDTKLASMVANSLNIGGKINLNTTGTIPPMGMVNLIVGNGGLSVTGTFAQTGSVWLKTNSSTNSWGVKNFN